MTYKVMQLITEGHLSSIEAISDELGIHPDTTRDIIQELVEAEALSGAFDVTSERFFRSDVRTSTAPIIPSQRQDIPIIVESETRLGKYVSILGLVMFIVGQFFPDSLVSGSLLADIGAVIVIGGLVVFIFGLMFLSRSNPPMKG